MLEEKVLGKKRIKIALLFLLPDMCDDGLGGFEGYMLGCTPFMACYFSFNWLNSICPLPVKRYFCRGYFCRGWRGESG